MDVATAKTTRLSPDPITALNPVVSPDGRRIAFIGYVERYTGGFYAIDAYVMDRDGLHARVLDSALDRVTYDPQWSPDGRASEDLATIAWFARFGGPAAQ